MILKDSTVINIHKMKKWFDHNEQNHDSVIWRPFQFSLHITQLLDLIVVTSNVPKTRVSWSTCAHHCLKWEVNKF